MKNIVSRCGFRCDECVAFIGRSKTVADRERAAQGWKKYFHLNFQPKDLHCKGCLTEGSGSCPLPGKDCEIRKCVIGRGMFTCADCIEFPCKKMDERMESVEKVIARYAGKISKEKYDSFIAPYDARRILNEIRDRRVDRVD